MALGDRPVPRPAGGRRVPATVVTGFLGAGKTTLIRHLLANAGGRRIALVINEFGDIGIDGELLRGCGDAACDDDDIIELANGCICCTVADDFLPTMRKLLDRADPPDHIVIETSGLALPKPLVQAFNWPEIRTRVTVDGVVAVVDAAAVSEGRFVTDVEAMAAQRAADPNLDHESPIEELYEDQLSCADMVILSKTDLLDDAAIARVAGAVGADVRPAVRLVRASHGAVEAAVLLGLSAAAEDDLAARPSHHDGDEDHDHDEFESFAVEFGSSHAIDDLLARIAAAVAGHGILRVKGFVDVAGRDMRLVVQGVGQRLSHYYDRDWRPGEARGSRLVVIGEQGLDRRAITAAIAG